MNVKKSMNSSFITGTIYALGFFLMLISTDISNACAPCAVSAAVPTAIVTCKIAYPSAVACAAYLQVTHPIDRLCSDDKNQQKDIRRLLKKFIPKKYWCYMPQRFAHPCCDPVLSGLHAHYEVGVEPCANPRKVGKGMACICGSLWCPVCWFGRATLGCLAENNGDTFDLLEKYDDPRYDDPAIGLKNLCSAPKEEKMSDSTSHVD